MANAASRPIDSRRWMTTMGVLALVATGLSVGIYVMTGHWPAQRGGIGPVFFLLLGVGLIAHARLADV